MNNKNIPNIENLVKKYVGATKRVIKCDVVDISKPGENYAGVMLGVDITVTDNGKTEVLHGVAKTPNFNVLEFFRNHISEHYKKEVSFYKNIVPSLEKFYRDEGVGEMPAIFPALYGERFNLTEDPDKVDEYALILLENLVEKGYSNIDRHIGFDLDGAKLVLKDLATLHASPIAMKLKNPKLFEDNIKKWANFQLDSKPPSHGDGPSKGGPFGKRPPHVVMLEILSEYDDAKPYLTQVADRMAMGGPRGKGPIREPFATVGHNDLWTNNTMQKVENGKIVANKLIDFQMLCYQSPVKDLVFFLSTSLRSDLLDGYFDELIKFYHQEFVNVLKKFHCDTSQFEWPQFKEELELEVGKEFGHIMAIIPAAFGNKGVAVYDHSKPLGDFDPNLISDLARQRAAKMVNMFGKRGWI